MVDFSNGVKKIMMRLFSLTGAALLTMLAIGSAGAREQDFSDVKKKAREVMPGEKTDEKETAVRDLGASKKTEAIDILLESLTTLDTLIAELEKKREKASKEPDNGGNSNGGQSGGGNQGGGGQGSGGKGKNKGGGNGGSGQGNGGGNGGGGFGPGNNGGGNFGPGNNGGGNFGPGNNWGSRSQNSSEASRLLERIRKEEKVKELIATTLGTMTEENLVRHMSGKLNAQKEPEIRAALSRALITGGAAEGIQAVTERVEKGRETTASVLLAIIDAITPKKSKDFVPLLAKTVQDPVWQIKLASARALGEIEANETLPALIAGMENAEGKVLYEMNEILAKKAGVDMQRSLPNWKGWWETNGKTLFPVQ